LGGKSETALRECLTSRHPREAYILTNKLSSHFIEKQADIRPLFQQQLEACGVEYFDFYLMHAQDKNSFEKYKQIEENEVLVEEYMTEDADIILVAYGIAARVSKNAIAAARAEGIKVGLVRPITLWPFPKATLEKLSHTAKAFISVEMSMGQMIEDVELATRCRKPVLLCNRSGGMIPTPEAVLAKIKEAGGIE
jgi:2-oxoglutarate ferredoxin oxidoreductase subunit alpha